MKWSGVERTARMNLDFDPAIEDTGGPCDPEVSDDRTVLSSPTWAVRAGGCANGLYREVGVR